VALCSQEWPVQSSKGLVSRPLIEIDLARFDPWARQLLVDAAADDPSAVTGDVGHPRVDLGSG